MLRMKKKKKAILRKVRNILSKRHRAVSQDKLTEGMMVFSLMS